MLVLARMRDQSIIIGDDITVTVADIRGDKVRLGISAPRSVSVHRKEIYDQIKEANQAASGLQPGDVAGVIASVPPPTLKLTRNDSVPLVPEQTALLKAAIEQAKLSGEAGVPIGAVLTRDNQIIGKGRDQRAQTGDPTAQAGIECLRNAGLQPTYRDTVMYCTAMPDFLSAAAIAQFGINRVIVGDTVNQRDGGPGQSAQRSASQLLQVSGVNVIDARDEECIALLSRLAKEHEDKRKAEPGEK